MRLLGQFLNSLFYFFYKKILLTPKAQKHEDATKQKHKTQQENKKNKNALKNI